MNSDNLKLTQLLQRDPNTLPYVITETQTERVVPVRFEPLVAGDEAELRGNVWSTATFQAVWPQLIGDERTLKLVCVTEEDKRIQGIVRLGQMLPTDGALVKSLLEAAPFNQQKAKQRKHQGVGRVLVVRLVVESYQMGGRGKVEVYATPERVPFYAAIGFKHTPNALGRFPLDEAGAIGLLLAALMPQFESNNIE